MPDKFTVIKRDGDDWAWEVLYPDGSLLDIYASKTEAEKVRANMQKIYAERIKPNVRN